MNISPSADPILKICSRIGFRFAGLMLALFASGSVLAQIPNPDMVPLFARNNICGTARTAGAGGAFSSVGADLGSMNLNPAGLGMIRTTDISITPGLRIAGDQSTYDGNTAKANHTIFQLAQGGVAFTIKSKHASDEKGSFGLKSITLAANYQTLSTFNRLQNFGAYNTSNSLVQTYANISNQQGTNLWSLEGQMFSYASLMGQNLAGKYYSNVLAPVQQSGSLSTSGALNNIDLGFGANFGDKLFFGMSLGIPIMNYTVNTQMSETNPNQNDTVTNFQNYQLASVVSEGGVGVTGKVGLIYKPSPWMRFGVSYSLPTWYFMQENYSADLLYTFDTSYYQNEVSSGPPTQVNYHLRTPMKGLVGASFYLEDHGFISVDYEFQNLGSSHYHFTDPGYSVLDTSYNSYIKSTYGFSHTVRVGIEGVIKKFRLRAGYSYTNSPFKSGQNYTSSSYNNILQNGTIGLGFVFKYFYFDLAYVLTYTKDGVSPNFQIPLDNINSRLITHSALLTLGFKIPQKGNTSSSKKPQRRSSDQLPKYIDPGDKY